MANLLAEAFRRLFKGKRFYVVLIVLCCIASFIPLLNFLLADSMEERGHADQLLFILAGQIPMFVSIAAGLLICQDFRNNTIRNKIIIGHSRASIYMANLIMSLVTMLIYYLANIIVVIILGNVLMSGFESFPSVGIFQKMLMIVAIETAFTSTIVFICNTMKTTGGFVLSLCMHYILSTFEPFLGLVPGKYRKAVDFIMEVVPSFQITLVVYNTKADGVPEKWYIILTACVIITVATTVLGIEAFNKSDLK